LKISSHPKLINSPLICFGRSLGGAVSVAIAAQYPDLVKGLILENTFLSISKMVDRLLPYVSILKPLVLRINWNRSFL
jgi:pimeloyl-ACP methyl ester carboxylesterase